MFLKCMYDRASDYVPYDNRVARRRYSGAAIRCNMGNYVVKLFKAPYEFGSGDIPHNDGPICRGRDSRRVIE
jgi:hypothetical protein